MSVARFHVGDVFEQMAKIPDGSVDLIVTSPPFLALRSYLPADHPDKGKEIGSEATPAAFLTTLLALTREWRRVLAPHGSICVELGDTYSGTSLGFTPEHATNGYGTAGRQRAEQSNRPDKRGAGWPLDKSLCLLPTLYPASLAYGYNMLDPTDVIDPWRIRNLIVWHRPNPPVGALGDKVRPSTSYVTVACMRRDRWFDLDAERQPYAENTLRGGTNGGENHKKRSAEAEGSGRRPTVPGDVRKLTHDGAPPLDHWQLPEDDSPNAAQREADARDFRIRNPKAHWQLPEDTCQTSLTPPARTTSAPAASVSSPTTEGDPAEHQTWTIPTQPYAGSHYATFPIALPRRLIRLMCPQHVCRTCGEPRRRITDRPDPIGLDNHKVKARANAGPGRGTLSAPDHDPQRVTLGWSDCGHDDYRRGIVLDPFAGSGTTLAAATEQGRDAIGIDLDARNLDLARERCGMFLEEAVA